MDPYLHAEDPRGEQRWRNGLARFVPPPPADCFDPSRASIAVLDESTAKGFVVKHHYSHSFPAARFRTGLFQKSPLGAEELVGVAVFGVPVQPKAINKYLNQEDACRGVELSRLVLLECAKFNAESWFISRSLRMLHRALPQITGVISYCDPVPRHDRQNRLTKPGHTGTVYRASNARYHGLSGPRTVILTPDGRVLNERSISKLRLNECGADYAYRQFLACGAPRRQPLEDGDAYVRRVLAGGAFRKTRHPGNHVFSFDLGPRL